MTLPWGAGSSTFFLLTYLAASWARAPATTPQRVQRNMVLLWATRLGLYLFTRVLKEGGDKRFSKARDSPAALLVFWTMQGKARR